MGCQWYEIEREGCFLLLQLPPFLGVTGATLREDATSPQSYSKERVLGVKLIHCELNCDM